MRAEYESGMEPEKLLLLRSRYLWDSQTQYRAVIGEKGLRGLQQVQRGVSR